VLLFFSLVVNITAAPYKSTVAAPWGSDYFFSIFFKMAVEFLNELNVPFFKVGSGDTNNFPYLKKLPKKVGMQSMETMRRVYETVKEHNQNFCILQCTSAYPLEPEDVNLRVIMEYQKEFPDIPIGYSGHESGISITVGAVALGAKVVERHVTLDKTWKGSDHAASLEPEELAELVRSIRTVERENRLHCLRLSFFIRLERN
uniref:N-acetylneuraminic acid synthase a n=1 Tax=Cyprinus carpio TaxID=7962 RepID=A0A8C1V5U5_CYPCA